MTYPEKRPQIFTVTLPSHPINPGFPFERLTFGPETDIPSILDAVWKIVVDRRLPVEYEP